MTLDKIKDELVRLIRSTPKSERAALLHSLLDDIYSQLQQPAKRTPVPSIEQRTMHMPKLNGKEFHVLHHGIRASFLIDADGKFCSPDGLKFGRPGPALFHQWKDILSKDKTSYNGWTAKDNNGKQVDDYIRHYIIND